MKRAVQILCVVLLLLLLVSCGKKTQTGTEAAMPAETAATGEELADSDALKVLKVDYFVKGFEWGPGVNRLLLSLDKEADGVDKSFDTAVKTAQWKRTVTKIYLSDETGEPTEGPSAYVSLELFTDLDSPGSPYEFDPAMMINHWAETYMVELSLGLILEGETVTVNYSGDCAENRHCPEMDLFPVVGSYTGQHQNVLSGSSEMQTLNYAATQPAELEGGEKNPLIIWLHGRGEGGLVIETAIVGNEVSALAEERIQSYFTSGDQTGAYVLVVQTPTYWMDAGDDIENEGDMDSRYETVLMETINAYLDSNPDVDRDRIYLIGGSNGGFMTMEMLVRYPDFFAAAVPCSPGFCYYVYAREDDGSYRTVGGSYVRTDDVFLTEKKIEALLQTPMWIVCSATDTLVPTNEYAAPIYRELLEAGAENCWCSLFIGVEGQEQGQTQYLGHWTWIYVFNDELSFVQSPQKILESDKSAYLCGMMPDREGGTTRVMVGDKAYRSVFAWLNDQSR